MNERSGPRHVKKCGYCGRESGDEAARCFECGTTFPESSTDTAPVPTPPRRPPEFLASALRYAGLILVLLLVYFLSFGPVEHYTASVAAGPPPRTAAALQGQSVTLVMTRTVTYPMWVGMVYYPAFQLRNANRLYARYLELWQ